MEHVLFLQRVREDKKEAYIQAHRNAPPALIETLRDSGVEREIIWIDGDKLYLYVMADNFDEAIAKQAESKVFQEWLQQMSPMLSEIQDYSGDGRVQKLEKIFDLEKALERNHIEGKE